MVTLNFIETLICVASNIHFVGQYTIWIKLICFRNVTEWVCALAVPVADTIIRNTPLNPVLFFVFSLTDKSKTSTSENSENQFLVTYWYKNIIGNINLTVSLIVSQIFCKTTFL